MNFKTLIFLIGAILNTLLVGAYISETTKCGGTIETYRWVISIFFALFFLISFIASYRKDIKNEE